MAALNSPLPDVSLPDLAGNAVRLSDFRGRRVVICFWSAECPWSQRADEELTRMARSWNGEVTVLRIASNIHESESDLRRAAAERGADPVLRDAGGRVADLLGAVSTPHIFLADADGILRYCGAIDDATMRRREPVRRYLADAVEALRRGVAPDPPETPAYGCAIVRSVG